MKRKTRKILDTLFIFALVYVLAIGWSDFACADDWTKADTAYELAFVAVSILDAGTTADIKNHDDMVEKNPLLRAYAGKNPSNQETVNYFIISTVAHAAISYSLPRKYRRLWQGATLVINGGIVANNYSLGLRWGF